MNIETTSPGTNRRVSRVWTITMLALDTETIVRKKLFNVKTARVLKIIASDFFFSINHVHNFCPYSKK